MLGSCGSYGPNSIFSKRLPQSYRLLAPHSLPKISA